MIDVIIPVYNTPIDDLQRCLDSVSKQTYSFFKVYIIDDGSNKATKEYLDNYVKLKNNFEVYHIANAGVSNARNYGMDISNSKYICFVDSDDTVSNHFLEESYNIIEENDLDIIIGGYNEIENNKVIKTRKCDEGLHIYDKANLNLFYDKLLSAKLKKENQEINDAPVGRIYTRLFKREAIKKLRFDKNITISEDTLFMIDMMKNIDKVGIVSKVWYNYYQNNYSVLHDSNYKKILEKNLTFIEAIYERMLNTNDDIIKNAFKMRILKTFINIYDILIKNNDLEYSKDILNNKYLNEIVTNINIDDYLNIEKERKFINLINEEKNR